MFVFCRGGPVQLHVSVNLVVIRFINNKFDNTVQHMLNCMFCGSKLVPSQSQPIFRINSLTELGNLPCAATHITGSRVEVAPLIELIGMAHWFEKF